MIAKTTRFCPVLNIHPYAGEVFRRLEDEDHLRGLTRSRFVDRIAAYYGDINALHPFREGNGRTQRAFLWQLAGDAGYHLAWARLDARQNVKASIASLAHGDEGPLRDMFDDLGERP